MIRRLLNGLLLWIARIINGPREVIVQEETFFLFLGGQTATNSLSEILTAETLESLSLLFIYMMVTDKVPEDNLKSLTILKY